MRFSFVCLYVIIPLVYALCVYLETKAHGWDRFIARAGGHEYGGDDKFIWPTPSPIEEGGPTPAPLARRQVFTMFMRKNPLVWIMPAVGLGLGLFANMVPAGSGLVLMPLLQELDVCKSSDGTLALACAIQFLNNGVLGLVTWSSRDARFFICRALFLLTPFAWAGTFVGSVNHLSFKDLVLSIDEATDDPNIRAEFDKNDIEKLHTYLRLGFGCFMLFMSIWALVGVCIGGMNRYCCPSHTGGSTPGGKSFCQWIIVLCCTFNSGWLFVSNIGSGMGVTTFFTLSLFLGVETKRAIPTAIVIGGWASLLPALGYNDTLPYVRVLMMFPGMWAGSLLAPWFSKCGGPMCDLFFFFIVLVAVGAAVVAVAAIKLQKGQGRY